MNGLIIVGGAIVVFICAYFTYGRWLAKTWGIDADAKTPAYRLEDGQDYVPATRQTVFAHQFSSIVGAGPVTGPIIAAMFGWLPALLWIVLGGVFFGAMQDFASIYISVKNDGKSMGMLIEQYIGRKARRFFLIFCWLIALLLLASFTDILANTFNGFMADGAQNVPGATAGSISLIYTFGAMAFGIFVLRVELLEELRFTIGLLLTITILSIGIDFPLFLSASTWRLIIVAYCFSAAVLPMWLLIQPRDYLSAFLLMGMVVGGAAGMLIQNPSLHMPAFVGFNVDGAPLFPFLFTTIACGAISGFHSFISTGGTSKALSSEGDILPVGYGTMLVESTLAVVALVIACSAAQDGILSKATPFQTFAAALSNFFQSLGMPRDISECIMTMSLSALTMTSIDSVARIARASFQELLNPSGERSASPLIRFLTNTYVATGLTLGLSYLLCLVGYRSIWVLFGAANQLLASLVLITVAVFVRVTRRKGWMLYGPMVFMFVVTMSSLALTVYGIFGKVNAGTFDRMTDGMQLGLALALMSLGVIVAAHSMKELVTGKIKRMD